VSSAVLWFRRDLRLSDNPALLAALASQVEQPAPGGTLPLFVLDPALWGPAGAVRRAYLLRSLRMLDASLAGRLHVRVGDPAVVVPRVTAEVGAPAVHCAADFGPYGARRDSAVERALVEAGRELVRTGSAYAVSPGRVRKSDGTPYRVYTPFYRAWAAHGWRAPAGGLPVNARWLQLAGCEPLPAEPDLGALKLPATGEEAALARWAAYRDGRLADYATHRNRADLAATSALSAALRWGEIHPRTLLADLVDPADLAGTPHQVFRKELAWREFYADVLHHEPATARQSMRTDLAGLDGGEHAVADAGADARFAAWCAGRTGYPFVDAGMRQLQAQGWVHNRVRMVVASFLVKDLHQPWTRGARWFMRWLCDGDLASNQHGWQWVAGTGTDAAPYFRVFNPVKQGLAFDPDGTYVRRYVPELAAVPGPAVHEPWKLAGGPPSSYPLPIVNHDEERRVALARYEAVTKSRRPSPNG
jgi:deoxyribodipyrimidine photo-lyase